MKHHTQEKQNEPVSVEKNAAVKRCSRELARDFYYLFYFILVQFTESPSILEPDEDLSFGEPNLLGEVDAFLARQERLFDEPRLHRVHLPAREHRAPARPVAMATRTCRDRDEPIGCCRCPVVIVRRTTAHVRRGSSPRAAEVLRRHNRTNKAIVDYHSSPPVWCCPLVCQFEHSSRSAKTQKLPNASQKTKPIHSTAFWLGIHVIRKLGLLDVIGDAVFWHCSILHVYTLKIKHAFKNKLLTSKHGKQFGFHRRNASFASPENYDFQTWCFGFGRQYRPTGLHPVDWHRSLFVILVVCRLD